MEEPITPTLQHSVGFFEEKGACLAGRLARRYFENMGIITARQLHEDTKSVLNQLEKGETLLITRNGRTIGRLEPLAAAAGTPGWTDIIAKNWRAQGSVKSLQAALAQMDATGEKAAPDEETICAEVRAHRKGR